MTPDDLAAACADLAGKAFVVDGNEVRVCRDAAAAMATVVRVKRPCSAVDLSTIRKGIEIKSGGPHYGIEPPGPIAA
jgi:hypothetical protein